MAVPISEVPFFDGMSGEDLAEIMLVTRTRAFVSGEQVLAKTMTQMACMSYCRARFGFTS